MKLKNWRGGTHVLAATALFLGVLFLGYQISYRHNRRVDLTREKLHSVSNETLEVLKRMERNDIRVSAFFAEGDPARREFEVLLKEMGTHHAHFRYEFFDPDRAPSEARRLKVDAYQTVVVTFENREERFQGATEEVLTNALIRLAHPKVQTICFTHGHGEISLNDTARVGLSDWRQVLLDHAYQVSEIELLGEEISPECNAAVLAGPRYELLPKEIELLRQYSKTGKGLLLLIDPMDSGVGASFKELLEPLGVKLGDNVVIDKVSRVLGGDFLVPFVARYADHPATKGFGVATFFPVARTVEKSKETVEGMEVTELAFTNPGSWGETDVQRLEKGEAELDPQADPAGPLSLAAAVEFQELPRGARWVVVGDSDFITNAHLPVSGNRDFALNLIQWLVRDDRWISIRVKAARFEPLFLRINQSVGIASYAIGFLPLTALAAGSMGIWLRRRKSD